jgi:hypothetical protein
MEPISTTAAVVQLLGLSIKVSKAAKSLGQSFLDAPKELVQLKVNLDLLHSRIEQLHDLSEGLPASDSTLLLPTEHHTMIATSLQTSFQALQKIQSLCNVRSGKSRTVTSRLQWAMVDKKKVDRIQKTVAKTETELNIVLAILGVYISLIFVPISTSSPNCLLFCLSAYRFPTCSNFSLIQSH